MRVFRNNRNGGLSFLAAQRIRYVPIGDDIELNLGPDPEIVFELVKRRVFRDNLWLRLRAGGVYRRADQPGIAIADDSELAGWDEHTLFEQRIGNYSGRLIEVQIRRQFDGDVTFRSPFDARLHDVRTVEFATRLDPATRTELRYQVSRREGYNREQSRVQLEQE